MIVKLQIPVGQTTGGPNIVVLSAGGKESPQNLRVNGRRIAQVAELMRSASAVVFDRANLTTRITFDVTKSYGSIEEAEISVLQAPGTYCRAGTVSFLAQGGQTFLRALTAVVESVDAQHKGIAATFSFSIVGGFILMLNAPPTSG